MKKIAIITGTSKHSIYLIEKIKMFNNISIVIDKSSTIKRVFKLLYKKRISFYLLCLMFITELIRKKEKKINHSNYYIIKKNIDLESIIKKESFDLIILFKAGLIINESILKKNIPIYNVHCAKIPEFSGLGSIYKAVKSNNLKQEVTMHKITKDIDSGEIILTNSYLLKKELSYRKNEDIAYHKGIELIIDFLKKQKKDT